MGWILLKGQFLGEKRGGVNQGNINKTVSDAGADGAAPVKNAKIFSFQIPAVTKLSRINTFTFSLGQTIEKIK